MLLTLPIEAILHICRYLDYKDLISVSLTSKLLNELADDDIFWKKLCKWYWLKESCPIDITWKIQFSKWYVKFGRYIKIYRRIRSAWDKLEDFTRTYCPSIHTTLNGGLSEDQLSRIEEKLHFSLPEDLRCSYRIHNGQEIERNSSQTIFAGLLGTKTNHMQLFLFADYFSSDHLLDLNEACEQYRLYRDLDGFLPVTICTVHFESQFIAIDESSGVDLGTIVHPVVGAIPPGVTAERDTSHDCFIMGKSFSDWFCDYADNVKARLYPVVENHIYRFLHEPSCCCDTNYITVTVATAFMPEFSSVTEASFVHAYFVTQWLSIMSVPRDRFHTIGYYGIILDYLLWWRTIENTLIDLCEQLADIQCTWPHSRIQKLDGLKLMASTLSNRMKMTEDAPDNEIWQLETRHWELTDADGEEEVVDGPGVVGDYPILKPGVEYSWISSTRFSTTYGSMKGHFTMKNLKTGQTLDVICPVFHMRSPPYITSDDRKHRKTQLKKNN